MANILIVDDEEMFTTLLRSHLEQQSHVVMSCRDACRGLAILSQGTINLLIADTHMPGKDGLGFISSARRLHRGVPIIASAASARTSPFAAHGIDYLKVARKLGADVALRKPVSLCELQEAVKLCLGADRTKAAVRL